MLQVLPQRAICRSQLNTSDRYRAFEGELVRWSTRTPLGVIHCRCWFLLRPPLVEKTDIGDEGSVDERLVAPLQTGPAWCVLQLLVRYLELWVKETFNPVKGGLEAVLDLDDGHEGFEQLGANERGVAKERELRGVGAEVEVEGVGAAEF